MDRSKNTITRRDFTKEDGYLFFLMPPAEQQEKEKPILKFLICITCYNESLDELIKTLEGVYKNIGEFKDYNIS